MKNERSGRHQERNKLDNIPFSIRYIRIQCWMVRNLASFSQIIIKILTDVKNVRYIGWCQFERSLRWLFYCDAYAEELSVSLIILCHKWCVNYVCWGYTRFSFNVWALCIASNPSWVTLYERPCNRLYWQGFS